MSLFHHDKCTGKGRIEYCARYEAPDDAAESVIALWSCLQDKILLCMSRHADVNKGWDGDAKKKPEDPVDAADYLATKDMAAFMSAVQAATGVVAIRTLTDFYAIGDMFEESA